MDTKPALAAKAFQLIKTNQVVGLGASSVMPYIIDLLVPAVHNGLQLQLVTSSFLTQELLLEKGLAVFPVQNFGMIDLYFDGCDQFDKNLNAVKSGGGIHTREKLLASMARQFVLLGDESKFTTRFDPRFPLVLEVLPEAFRYIQAIIKEKFPGTQTSLRLSDKKIGAALSDNGNYLLDCWFREWPAPSLLHDAVKSIAGVVETSLFFQLAHLALMPFDEAIHAPNRL